MKFYVATGLANHEKAARVRDLLCTLGHYITEDWTIAGISDPLDPRLSEEEAFEKAKGPKDIIEGDLAAAGEADLTGVTSADCVIVVLPGGRGTHTELGIALGVQWARSDISGRDEDPAIFLWAEGGLSEHDLPYPCPFYRLQSVRLVTGDVADLVAAVEGWDKGNRYR